MTPDGHLGAHGLRETMHAALRDASLMSELSDALLSVGTRDLQMRRILSQNPMSVCALKGC
jgi:hypothetical protein